MNAQERRKALLQYLNNNRLEHGLVHVSATNLAKAFNTTINCINNDVKELLIQGKLKYFCKEASMFEIQGG